MLFSRGRAGHHHRLRDEPAGGRAPHPPLAGVQIKLLNGLQGIVAPLPLSHRHPGEAGLQSLARGVHHGELTAALLQPLALHGTGAGIDPATPQLSFWNRAKVDLTEIHLGADRREIVVVDRIHHHLAGRRIFEGIEVVKHKPLGCRHQNRAGTGMVAALARHQPELTRFTGLGRQALGRTLLTEHERQGVERHGVLQEHRPTGGDGEIVKEGEALEAVAAVGHQITGPHTTGLILCRKLHQPDGAGGSGLDAKGDHAGFAVVPGVKTGMGAERLTGLEHPGQSRQFPGLQGAGIESMGLSRFPERQQLITEPHHLGVGDVLEPQIKGIGQRAARFLGAEHPPVDKLAGILFSQPTFGANKTVGQIGLSGIKPKCCNHPVAIEGMMHPAATTLQASGPVAVKGASQISGNAAPRCNQWHIREFNSHVAKGAGPVVTCVGGLMACRLRGGGGGHPGDPASALAN